MLGKFEINMPMREISTDSDSAATGSIEFADKLERLEKGVVTVLKGKEGVARLAVVALLSRGHLLIEDVPGIGKTTLANALARSLGLSFQRIQFTSDLLPSDLTGLSIFNQRTGDFDWRPGPIFSNIVLADEINRATPKTQSALLEAMAERQVTSEGVTRPLPDPFMVIATQNPTEHHGTYPLPESQLDRFAMRIGIGYPDLESEREMLRSRDSVDPVDSLESVLSPTDLRQIQSRVADVRFADDLVSYLLEIVDRTRNSDAFELGISPRGSLALHRCAQAMALIEGRDFCIPDDIKRLVVPVFAHRVKMSGRYGSISSASGGAADALVRILDNVPVPV
jgi:MoxR-like ATPase